MLDIIRISAMRNRIMMMKYPKENLYVGKIIDCYLGNNVILVIETQLGTTTCSKLAMIKAETEPEFEEGKIIIKRDDVLMLKS